MTEKVLRQLCILMLQIYLDIDMNIVFPLDIDFVGGLTMCEAQLTTLLILVALSSLFDTADHKLLFVDICRS